MNLALPIIDDGPQRPTYAQGPRSLASVRLLRLSVTDRCNLRCVYCMPEEGVTWMAPRADLLRPADYEAVARTAVTLGVDHLKITGGEPTVRNDIVEIVARLRKLESIRAPLEISMTTNGVLLPRCVDDLRSAGLDRITLSCDSLRPERYRSITQRGTLDEFWRGVEAAERAGYGRLKVNVVVMAGVNDDEVVDFARLVRERDWTVRFIEYMPLGDSALTVADPDAAIVDNETIMTRIADAFGPLEPADRRREAGVGPAQVFRFPGARGKVGFISAMSKPFCESCNRLRLTALGELRSCLFDGGEVDLRPHLHPQPDPDGLARAFADCVVLKPETHSARGNRAMSQLGG